MILISLKIHQKENQKFKFPIDAPKLPEPLINPPTTNWLGNQKNIKERNFQIAKQVPTKDYIDYYKMRWLAHHRSQNLKKLKWARWNFWKKVNFGKVLFPNFVNGRETFEHKFSAINIITSLIYYYFFFLMNDWTTVTWVQALLNEVVQQRIIR